MNLEKIRRDISFIGKAIENHDEIVSNLIDARWRHDMIVALPELGVARDPRTSQPTVISPADMQVNIEGLEKQRQAAETVAVQLTGASDMDGARQTYLDMLGAYQRLGSLRELERLSSVGFENALEEAGKIVGGIPHATKGALAHLENAVAPINTEISRIERVPSGMVLPS